MAIKPIFAQTSRLSSKPEVIKFNWNINTLTHYNSFWSKCGYAISSEFPAEWLSFIFEKCALHSGLQKIYIDLQEVVARNLMKPSISCVRC